VSNTDPEYHWKEECLADYVRERMTPMQFAEHVGVSRSGAYAILSGSKWSNIPRPAAFQYPWPENTSPTVLHRQRRLAYCAAVQKFEEEQWTYRQLAAHLGVPLQTAYDAVQRERKLKTRDSTNETRLTRLD